MQLTTTDPDTAIWPQVSDARLLELLERHIEDSLTVLQDGVEDGLGKLTDALDRHPVKEIEDDILAVFTDFQNIDRVVQRLGNVQKCLAQWRRSAANGSGSDPAWAAVVASSYVMQEEHVTQKMVLKSGNYGDSDG